MSAYNFELCNCQCHGSMKVIHCAPCCQMCPHCGMDRIPHYAIANHIEECKKENPETPFAIPDTIINISK